jgi:Ni/Fe-hydrogenase 1 B-type cytochrome subunit
MFRRPRSNWFRIWHWLSAFVVLSLLGTVLLRKTLLRPSVTGMWIRHQLNAKGTHITTEQARAVGEDLADHLWTWHINLGWCLLFLLGFRAVVWFVDRPLRRAFVAPQVWHYRGVNWLYRLLYVSLLVMIASGMGLVYGHLELRPDLEDFVSWLHANVMWLVAIFVVVHIAGVWNAERGEDHGIVSEMLYRPPRE